MKALVLGLGLSGKSACEFLKKRGYEVVGLDDAWAPKQIHNIEEFSLVVVSPGIPREHPLVLAAKNANIPIKGEVQIALEQISVPCIGVTGTNGKTTLVKFLAHCLQKCGHKALAVGNVGVPLTSCAEREEILVVELSSYQLETLSEKVFTIGVILNIAEDHLDRYASMQEYAEAKTQLQYCIKEKGKLFVHESVDSTLFTKPFQSYSGDHLKAAQMVCSFFGINKEEFLDASASFVKPPHRLEWVEEIAGVSYYNDSKATNVAAVLYALETVQDSVVLLLGGKDKGLSFSPIKKYVKKCTKIIAFGEAREKIANTLQDCQVLQVETMQEATKMAMHLAQKGQAVLLSPGCASFDAFANYETRGEEFKRLVEEARKGARK